MVCRCWLFVGQMVASPADHCDPELRKKQMMEIVGWILNRFGCSCHPVFVFQSTAELQITSAFKCWNVFKQCEQRLFTCCKLFTNYLLWNKCTSSAPPTYKHAPLCSILLLMWAWKSKVEVIGFVCSNIIKPGKQYSSNPGRGAITELAC